MAIEQETLHDEPEDFSAPEDQPHESELSVRMSPKFRESLERIKSALMESNPDPEDKKSVDAAAAFQTYADMLHEMGYFVEGGEITRVVAGAHDELPNALYLYTIYRDGTRLDSPSVYEAASVVTDTSLATYETVAVSFQILRESEFESLSDRYPEPDNLVDFIPSSMIPSPTS